MAYDETYDSSLLLKLEAVKIMFTRPYELSFMEKKNTHTHRTRLKTKKMKNTVSFMVTRTF